MAKDYYEKDYNDEVYEDKYYEENYEEEELEEDEEEVVKEGFHIVSADDDDDDDEDEVAKGGEDDDEAFDDDEEEGKRVGVSYACEDCDYRWDDIVIKKKGFEDVEEELDPVCPMCGSMNITQI